MMKLRSNIFWPIWLLAASSSSVASAASAASAKNQRDKDDTRPSIRAREDDDRPNVIFILAEDMGWGDLACYGHPYARTPNLDRLAADGTRFNRFYVAGATCNPSRTGFMTSRTPPTMPNSNHAFPKNMATITKLLHDSGYVTGHIGKWHLGPMDNETHQTLGIDEIKVMAGAERDPLGREERVYEAGMDFIERHKDRPFYLNLWGHVAHSPVKPRESLVSEFNINNITVERSKFDRYMQEKFDIAEALGGENAIQIGMKNYLADIWSMDRNIGRLMDKLDQLGISHNTILAFTADHGAAPIKTHKQSHPANMMGWSGGFKGGKHTFYEGGVRVPFILRWPGRIPAGEVDDKSIISALDWLPTVCNLAKVSIREDMFDGEDVSYIMLGEKQRPRRDPLFWKFQRYPSDGAMLYGDWKLFANEKGYFNLYDLNRDSAESVDQINAEPEIANEMKQKLLQWEESLPRQYCSLKRGCETPIPFDGTTRPTYVGPPEILLADDG